VIDMNKEALEIVAIHKERQLAMQELSEQLGIDISFSDEELQQYIEEDIAKAIELKIEKEVEKWMKSAFS
tara:strand:- start:949 stop:1158 length:210 start_codon:yes stop_codon:yes gene_type:complete